MTSDLILPLLPLVYRSFNPTVFFFYLLRTRFLDTIVRRDRILQFRCNILVFRPIFTKKNPQSIVIVAFLPLIIWFLNPQFRFSSSFWVTTINTIFGSCQKTSSKLSPSNSRANSASDNSISIAIVGLLSLILRSLNPTFHFLYSFSIVVFATILCISQFVHTNIVFRSFELY